MTQTHQRTFIAVLVAMSSLNTVACGSSDPTGSGGEGKLSFTTWGEEYVEEAIPPDSASAGGFVDGWTVKYSKFLVNLRNITVADAGGGIALQQVGSVLFDNHVRGVKSIAQFDGIPAKAWSDVSYEIAPVAQETELSDSATEDDKQLMLQGKYSLYVEATASKGDRTKRFAWGFAIGTKYQACHSEQDGRDEAGVVVTNNSETVVELTTHGDHLYYDRLQSSSDPAIITSLRFDAIAAADADDDGEISFAELNAAPLDLELYDPSGLPATSHGDFITSLARTVGHFRGEGECTIRALKP